MREGLTVDVYISKGVLDSAQQIHAGNVVPAQQSDKAAAGAGC